MDLKVSKKYTKERKLANIIVEKLKNKATMLESDDITHKNGIKFIISKKIYKNIIYNEFKNRNTPNKDIIIIKEFINRRLISVY